MAMETSRLSINETVKLLSNAYISLILSGEPFCAFPSVMLWGSPGVGKSQGVRQIAKQIENNTGKKVNITDVRLLLFNPIDLRGIPTANEDKTLAVWLKPKIFQMDESEDVVNVLFLDEISAAPQSVQAAAYQITLDRTVGEHKLPENCIVIAAGNRVSDKSVAYNMPKALANRLCHITVGVDADSWHDWAINSGINEKVIGFLSYKPSMLIDFEAASDELAFPTPRTWEMVSNILNMFTGDIMELEPLIRGCIGAVATYEFLVWCEVFNKIPNIEKIFDGTETSIITRPEILFALTSKIVSYAKMHNSKEEINNSIRYIEKLPAEFKSMIYNDYRNIKSIGKILEANNDYSYWYLRNGYSWE